MAKNIHYTALLVFDSILQLLGGNNSENCHRKQDAITQTQV